MIDKDLEAEALAGGRRDWNAWLMEFFVRNPRLVILIVAFLVIGGTLSLMTLQRQGFPEVSPKILMVQTVYPGAGSEEVERQVTKPLEDALKGTAGIDEVRSSSMNSFSNIVVQLESKTDVDQETQEIRNKILLVEGELPKDAEKPEVAKFSFDEAAFVLGVFGKSDIEPVSTKIIDELSKVEGVKSVEPVVAKPKQVMVRVDAAKLAKSGVPVDQLVQIMKGSSVNFPVTRMDLDQENQTLLVVGSFDSVDELREVSVGINKMTGQPVRLKDIGEVGLRSAPVEEIETFGTSRDGKLSVHSGSMLAVNLTKNTDIIRARAAVSKRLQELRDDHVIPKQVQVDYVMDNAADTKKQVEEIVNGALGKRSNLWLLGGIQLVIISMLLFVNVRAAILAALSIPLSLGFTFIYLQGMGISLNTIVLFALVLVLGLIVDPAIVIVESIQRYRDLEYAPRVAVQATARRYGAGVFMATFTNWIVFLPFAVVSGILGDIIRYLPVTVIPALVASYFVPVAVLPLLSERWLKPHKLATTDDVKSLWRAAQGMMRLNHWVLARWWRQLLVIVIVVALTGASMSLMFTGRVKVVQFSQPDDNAQLVANVGFDKGLTKAKKIEFAGEIESELTQEKGIKTFYYVDQGRDKVTIRMILNSKRDRRDRSKNIAKRLNNSLADKKDYEFKVLEVGYGAPQADYQIQVQLYDNDLPQLKKAAIEVGDYLEGLKGVQQVDNGVSSASEPEVRLVIDRSEADKRGLNGFLVGQAMKTMLDDTKVTKLDDPARDRTLDVMLRVDGETKPTSTEELGELTITNQLGTPVKIEDIATVEKTESLAQIERFEGQRFLTVRARVDEKQTAYVHDKLDDFLTPARLDELEIDGKTNKGEFEDIGESFNELYVALALAIFLTYLALVLQFRSFAQPTIMLFTIPPALIGVFPVLWLLKNQFGFLELLGITILVGIVENVAIFLIDYANQRIRQDGMDPQEAIVLASGVRFRPIILTKVVALASLMPLAIESPFWRGLAVTIIAGIGLSGLFSMVIIPILFMWIVRVEKGLGFQL